MAPLHMAQGSSVKCLRCGAQGHDLGVRRGIKPFDRGVAASGNHTPVFHHHRPHRHLPALGGGAGFGQRQAHEVGVVGFGRKGHSASVGEPPYPTL